MSDLIDPTAPWLGFPTVEIKTGPSTVRTIANSGLGESLNVTYSTDTFLPLLTASVVSTFFRYSEIPTSTVIEFSVEQSASVPGLERLTEVTISYNGSDFSVELPNGDVFVFDENGAADLARALEILRVPPNAATAFATALYDLGETIDEYVSTQ